MHRFIVLCHMFLILHHSPQAGMALRTWLSRPSHCHYAFNIHVRCQKHNTSRTVYHTQYVIKCCTISQTVDKLLSCDAFALTPCTLCIEHSTSSCSLCSQMCNCFGMSGMRSSVSFRRARTYLGLLLQLRPAQSCSRMRRSSPPVMPPQRTKCRGSLQKMAAAVRGVKDTGVPLATGFLVLAAATLPVERLMRR